MDLVEVKIKGTVVTARYGSLSSGDILRTDAAFAKHLVEDCASAEYVDAAQSTGGEQTITQNTETGTGTVGAATEAGLPAAPDTQADVQEVVASEALPAQTGRKRGAK